MSSPILKNIKNNPQSTEPMALIRQGRRAWKYLICHNILHYPWQKNSDIEEINLGSSKDDIMDKVRLHLNLNWKGVDLIRIK